MEGEVESDRRLTDWPWRVWRSLLACDPYFLCSVSIATFSDLCPGRCFWQIETSGTWGSGQCQEKWIWQPVVAHKQQSGNVLVWPDLNFDLKGYLLIDFLRWEWYWVTRSGVHNLTTNREARPGAHRSDLWLSLTQICSLGLPQVFFFGFFKKFKWNLVWNPFANTILLIFFYLVILCAHCSR